MVGRPSGKKSCDDCSFKKRKCTHAEINLKRTLDSTLVKENLLLLENFSMETLNGGSEKNKLQLLFFMEYVTVMSVPYFCIEMCCCLPYFCVLYLPFLCIKNIFLSMKYAAWHISVC